HHWPKTVHEPRTGDVSANPEHGFAKQPVRRPAELPDFNLFHAGSLDYAVSPHGFLKNLAEFSRARLTVLHRTADALPQFSHGPNYQRQKDRRTNRHGPIEPKEHGDEYD